MGILLAFSAAVLFAFSAILIRLALEHLRPTTSTVLSLLSGLVLVMSLALGFHWGVIKALSFGMFFWFFLSGLLNFPLGRFMNFSSVQRLGVSRALPVINSAPLFAATFAIIFLGEEMTAPLLIGTIAVMGGIILIVSEK